MLDSIVQLYNTAVVGEEGEYSLIDCSQNKLEGPGETLTASSRHVGFSYLMIFDGQSLTVTSHSSLVILFNIYHLSFGKIASHSTLWILCGRSGFRDICGREQVMIK